jgi:hypothetical protein
MSEASKYKYIRMCECMCVFINSELQLMNVYLHAYFFVCHLVLTHQYEDSLHLALTETI